VVFLTCNIGAERLPLAELAADHGIFLSNNKISIASKFIWDKRALPSRARTNKGRIEFFAWNRVNFDL
jgi:hypothetical protein